MNKTFSEDVKKGENIPNPSSDRVRNWSKSTYLPHVLNLAVIAISAFLIYSNTLSAGFAFDDFRVITEDMKIRNPGNYWPPSGTRWLGYLSFALNFYVGGTEPLIYHLVNISIHAVNGCLVYMLVCLLLIITRYGIGNPLGLSEKHTGEGVTVVLSVSDRIYALLTALFFTVHPVQTQAVTYIVQRFTSLATFFYLASVVFYLRSRLDIDNDIEDRKNRYRGYFYYSLSLLSAVLSMKTKEISFTLPLTLTACETIFFRQKKMRRSASYLLPFILTLLIIPASIGINLPADEAVNIDEVFGKAAETPHISRSDYLFTQFRVIITYIRLLILPINQNLDYDYPVYRSFFVPEVLASFLVLSSIAVCGIYLLYISSKNDNKNGHRHRLTAFGIFWFFMALSVESSIIPINDVIFEHRLYLPSVGFFLAVVSGAETAGKNMNSRTMLYIASAAIIALSFATIARNSIWHDSFSLWSDTARKSPEKSRVRFNLGNAYRDMGRFDEAASEYRATLRISPDHIRARNNLGATYAELGRFDDAINEYREVLKISPFDVKTHNNLGAAYAGLGRFDEAATEFITVLRIKPDDQNAMKNLEYVLRRK